MNLAPFQAALVGGIILLITEVLADRFQLDDFGKIGVLVVVSALTVISLVIVLYGGLFLLGKALIKAILFFILLFLPVALYEATKK